MGQAAKILLFPVTAPYRILRLILRFGAKILLPVEIVFLLFGFGIAWCLYQAWSIVYWDEAEKTDWKLWGYHLTEAGFDTLTVFVLACIASELVWKTSLLDILDQWMGNAEAAVWIPFWTIALVPFFIRLHFAEPVELERLDLNDNAQ